MLQDSEVVTVARPWPSPDSVGAITSPGSCAQGATVRCIADRPAERRPAASCPVCRTGSACRPDSASWRSGRPSRLVSWSSPRWARPAQRRSPCSAEPKNCSRTSLVRSTTSSGSTSCIYRLKVVWNIGLASVEASLKRPEAADLTMESGTACKTKLKLTCSISTRCHTLAYRVTIQLETCSSGRIPG